MLCISAMCAYTYVNYVYINTAWRVQVLCLNPKYVNYNNHHDFINSLRTFQKHYGQSKNPRSCSVEHRTLESRLIPKSTVLWIPHFFNSLFKQSFSGRNWFFSLWVTLEKVEWSNWILLFQTQAKGNCLISGNFVIERFRSTVEQWLKLNNLHFYIFDQKENRPIEKNDINFKIRYSRNLFQPQHSMILPYGPYLTYSRSQFSQQGCTVSDKDDKPERLKKCAFRGQLEKSTRCFGNEKGKCFLN